MTTPSQVQNPMGLQHLEGSSFDSVLGWLERALRGKEALLKVVPEESPEDPILRQERSLSEIKREDLREACRVLIRRFVKGPENDDVYVLALLRLAKGFGLSQVVVDLHRLAADPDSFALLPAPQAKGVLHTLLDLKAQLALTFWAEIAKSPLHGAQVIAISALLGHGLQAAFEVIASLPDDEATADALFVVLDQHVRQLNLTEVAKMEALAHEVSGFSSPQIQMALRDWLQARNATGIPPHTEIGSSKNPALDSGLSAYAARKKRTFEPRPRPAKLVAA